MRTFGHQRPIRDAAGVVTSHAPSPVCAVTRDELGGAFGRDKRRRVVFTLAAGDVIQMRPSGTTRTITIPAKDVYRRALECAAMTFMRKVKEYKKEMPLGAARRKARKELGL